MHVCIIDTRSPRAQPACSCVALAVFHSHSRGKGLQGRQYWDGGPEVWVHGVLVLLGIRHRARYGLARERQEEAAGVAPIDLTGIRYQITRE